MALDNLRADAEAAFPRRTRRDADQTRRDILAAAAAEFSEKGYAGGRVDDIAARTSSTKRMIYYYFGGKDGLYAAVLEQAYGGMRDAEGALRLDELPPAEAMQRLVETTFDHQKRPTVMRDFEVVRLGAVRRASKARRSSPTPAIAASASG